MSQYIIKKGDLEPPFDTDLKKNGEASDLTSAVGASCRLELPDGTRLAGAGTTTIVDAAAGSVSYQWAPGETDVVGEVKVEIVIEWPSSRPSTYPSNGHLSAIVNESLA